jgi:prepilin-type N-terminal cleavage/methylation domain-containing protein
MKRQGLTLVETLIALAVVGIAFGALLLSQVSNLRASAQSRYATDAKAAAVRVLEAKSAEVLKSEILTPPSPYIDDSQTNRSFYFVDYFYRCPSTVKPPNALRGGNQNNLRQVACSGTENLGAVRVSWDVLGESGIRGEGVVTIVVTATHNRGARVTMGRRVTCYDVYPSPTQDKPAPCPPPGGGRP